MKQRPNLILRKGVALAALVAPVTGCGSETPEEAFRGAIDNLCDTAIRCEVPSVDLCATAASRDAIVTDLRADILATSDQGCLDTFFDVYADYYDCYANQTCDQIAAESGSCDSIGVAAEARVAEACPGLDL